MDMGQERVIKTDDCKACLCQVGNIPAEKQEVIHWREGTLHETSQ